MTARLDLTVQRNADWARSLAFTDSTGAALDLTGATFNMKIRTNAGAPGAALMSATVALDGAATLGKINVSIDGQTLSAAVPAGTQEAVVLAYDLIATQGGFDIPLVAGALTLIPGVS